MKKKISFLLAFAISLSTFSNAFITKTYANGTIGTLPTIETSNNNYDTYLSNLSTFITNGVGTNVTATSLNNNLANATFEKGVAQREFINKVGATTLNNFATTTEKKAFLNWIFNDAEIMNLFNESGEQMLAPYKNFGYDKVMDTWFDLYTKDPDSRVHGVNMRLAMASALRHGDGFVEEWADNKGVTAYSRYLYYKNAEIANKFPISLTTRSVWDLKQIVNIQTTNEDIDYMREVKHAGRYDAAKTNLNVIWPPYQWTGPETTEVGMRRVYIQGGVCGTASMTGAIAQKSFGIPAFLIGQPGHAAVAAYNPQTYGKWDIKYDVGGWGVADHNHRDTVPFNYYNDYSDKMYPNVAFLFTYEDARANQASFRKSYQMRWIANSITNYNVAQAIRKVGLDVNKYNIDLWRDHLKAMKTYWNQVIATNIVDKATVTASSTSFNSTSESHTNLIDGNLGSIWHTKYNGTKDVLPQSVTFTFSKLESLKTLGYVPRSGAGNGTITKYNLYTSVDGTTFTKTITDGTLTANNGEKLIDIPTTPIKALRLEVLEGVNGFGSGAEVNFYKPLAQDPIAHDVFVATAYDIFDRLKDHPIAVYHMFREIENYVINDRMTPQERQRLTITYNNTLDYGATLSSKQRQVVEKLKGLLASSPNAFVDFNFDGTNANRLMNSEQGMEYSLDGGTTWTAISEKNQLLTQQEVASINATNDIRARVIGTSDSVLLDIAPSPTLPTIYINDDTNKVFNMSTALSYSVDGGQTWTKYVDDTQLPDLTGDVEFKVSIPPAGKTLGSIVKTYTFSSRVDNSLILPSGIVGATGNADTRQPLANAFDGNLATFWHTNWETYSPLPQAITIELKEKANVYKLEYSPRQDGGSNGNITAYNIYASEDGTNYIPIYSGTWTNNNQVKEAIFNAVNVKFLKFEVTAGQAGHASAAEIRLFKSDIVVPNVSYALDGTNANKLMGTNTLMEYSVDGGTTYKPITTVNMPLTSDDQRTIAPGSTIKVRFKGSQEVVTMTFKACENPTGVTNDDTANTVIGLDDTMEYSIDGVNWVRYNGTMPLDLRANLDLMVRRAATGLTMAGCEITLRFTTELVSDARSNTTYKFISKYSGRSFDASGGNSGEDVQIIQYNYGGGNNQLVYLDQIEPNVYTLKMKHSGRVLTPTGFSREKNIQLVQKTYVGDQTQKWSLVNLGGGEYQVINVATGYALHADAGRSSIYTAPLNYSSNQVWQVSYSQTEVVPTTTFSFDGTNANKIMGSTTSMVYSVDGGTTWKSITAADMTLPSADITALSALTNLKVRVRDNAGIQTIAIAQKPLAPSVSVNDRDNTITGITTAMEYSLDNGTTWLKYTSASFQKPVGDISVLVRLSGQGLTPPGATTTLSFTEMIYIPVNTPLVLTDHIQENSSQGTDVNSTINIFENTTDTTKEGNYTIKYTYLDGATTKTVIRDVKVVNKRDYLSDITQKSAVVGYSTLKKDTNLNGGKIILSKAVGKQTFNKGLTSHAQAEVVYDLTNKGYTNFVGHAGLDATAGTGGSVIFKIYVDGILKLDTGLMVGNQANKNFDIDVTNAKELKLVADSNGANGADHSAWGDVKLLTVNNTVVEDKLGTVTVAYVDMSGNTIKASEQVQATNTYDVTNKKLDTIVVGNKTYAYASTTGNMTGTITTNGQQISVTYKYNLVVDTTALKAKIAEAEALDSTIYTSTSWQALQTKVNDAKALLATSLTQAQADTAMNNIQTAMNNLVLADKVGTVTVAYVDMLGNTIKASEQVQASNTYDVTNKKLDNIVVGNKTYAYAATTGNPTGTITTNGQQISVTYKYNLVVDTTALKAKIAEAEALDSTIYTSTSWQALQTKVNDAKALLATSLTQAQADTAMNNISTAMNNLVLADKVGTVTVAYVDMSGNTIKASEQVQASNTYDVTNKKLDTIVVGNKTYAYASTTGNPTGTITTSGQQISVTYKYNLYADSTALKAKIAQAEALNASDYEATSWQTLQTRINEAKTLLTNGASQVQFDQATTNIQQAIDALQPYVGQAPTITASDLSFTTSQTINYMSGVSASDFEDGNITSQVTYTTTYVAGQTGTFTVTYSVTDTHGNKTTKTINLVVTSDQTNVSFSFDGTNANKLMGSTTAMQYSIDGGTTYKAITSADMTLSQTELAALTPTNDIKVRLGSSGTVQTIDIKPVPTAPNVTMDDQKNIIKDATSSMEYSLDLQKTWATYDATKLPALQTNILVYVRSKATGLVPASQSKMLKFTAKISVPLNKAFNLTDYVSEKSLTGTDITSTINILDNKVDTTKEGTYTITYEVVENAQKSTIVREIEVVNKLDYLSDLTYKSAVTGWDTVKLDTNLNSSKNGGKIVLYSNVGKDLYKKGVTAHATSTIVYDLTNKGYTNFESYVGIDDSVVNDAANVIFKVYVDGVLKYESPEMKSYMPVQYVNVDVTGANELKIVADKNGADWSDHSVWGDAKLMINNHVGQATINYVDQANNAIATQKQVEIKNNYDVSSNKLATIKVGEKTYAYNATTGQETGTITEDGYQTTITYKYVVSSDKTSLKAKITQADALVASNYETNSWQAMQTKLTAAKTVYSDANATQSEIDQALSNLTNAITALQPFTGQVPTITASNQTYKVGETINYMAGVSATDQEDGNLTSSVTYTTTYVANTPGTYTITYSVTDSHGNKTTKTVNLIIEAVVVPPTTSTYASDLTWFDGYSDLGAPKLNTSFTGSVLKLWDGTAEQTFTKGLGTNSYSEIIYDISGKGFKSFTSYIGVDRVATTRGTAQFKVAVDGKVVYTSGIKTRTSTMELINIDVTNASRITLIVMDGGDGTSQDRANWADAKFNK